MTKVEQKNYLNTEVRYLMTLGQIQAEGILVFDNYPSCCGSCTSYEIEQEHPDTDYISFHNSQGRALRFEDGVPYNYETYDEGESHETKRRATDLYWSFSTLNAARVTTEAFKRNGFTVDWDGTDWKCVTIVF